MRPKPTGFRLLSNSRAIRVAVEAINSTGLGLRFCLVARKNQAN